jgi:hypothetical protein
VRPTSAFIMAPHREQAGEQAEPPHGGQQYALTFDSYAGLRDLLAELPHRGDARVLVLRGATRCHPGGLAS